MFEREIKFIYDFNLNKINRLGPYFTFEQLLASDIHPAILQYISAEIDYLIYEDRQKLLKNSLFDYSGEKISFHFNQISEEAKKSKRFAQEYIAKLILHASSFTINYLVRPKWTLTKFVFDEDNHKSTNDIKQILNYVYYYKYVNKILISYINSKKILSMNAQEFEELLNRADKLGVETYLPAILTSALKSMAEFFNIGEIHKAKIPLSAIEMFLEEKELIKHLQKVNEVFGNEEGIKFNVSDYEKVFKNIIIEKEELIVEPDEPQLFEMEEAEEKREIVEEPESGDSETEEEIIEIQKSAGEIEQPKQMYEPDRETDESQEPDEEEVQDEIEVTYTTQNDDRAQDSEDNEPDEDVEQNQEFEKIMDVVDEDAYDDIAEDEIKEESTEEVIISAPVKYRIKVNEDISIEPVIDKTAEKSEQPKLFDDDELDEPDEIEEDELIEEHEEEDENNAEQIGELRFDDEFKLAEQEFEEEREDDGSFLQSIRDQKNKPQQLEDDVEPVLQTVPLDQDETDEIPESNDTLEESLIEEELKSEDDNERVIFTEQKIDDDESNQINDLTSEEQSKVDLAEILEHKEMTKIIEVIFDYDIEDFASTLDEISNCKNEDDAHLVINNTLISRRINRSSKEAQAFRSIISEYFSDK